MEPATVKIGTPFIRLDSFLKLCGAFETGGRAKIAVQSGEVKVNGETCVTRGKKLFPGDRAECGGKIYGVERA